MSNLHPIIEQLHRANDDKTRAQVLLEVPDAILVKYTQVFFNACARAKFQSGCDFVSLRINALQAKRDPSGLLPIALASNLEAHRIAFSRFAASDDGQ